MYNLWNYLSSLPAVTGDQYYAKQPVELAPGAFFNRVLVPTTTDIEGDFQDFGGAIYDPLTGTDGGAPTQFGVDYNLALGHYSVFAGNIIPTSLPYGIYAFRIGPDLPDSSTPEPGAFLLVGLGLMALTSTGAKRKS